MDFTHIITSILDACPTRRFLVCLLIGIGLLVVAHRYIPESILTKEVGPAVVVAACGVGLIWDIRGLKKRR